MKKVTIFILLTVCMFVLTGCKSIDYGIVVDKSFRKAYTSYNPIIMIVNNHTRIIPRWTNHPDKWAILVENEDGREWWDVTENYYNSVEIGRNVDRR